MYGTSTSSSEILLCLCSEAEENSQLETSPTRWKLLQYFLLLKGWTLQAMQSKDNLPLIHAAPMPCHITRLTGVQPLQSRLLLPQKMAADKYSRHSQCTSLTSTFGRTNHSSSFLGSCPTPSGQMQHGPSRSVSTHLQLSHRVKDSRSAHRMGL